IADVVRELEAWGRAMSGPGLLVGPEDYAALSLPARCALTTALLDHEKRRGAVTSEKHPVRCNATLVTGAPDAVAAEAERWAADGFGTFKLKVGAGEDVAQVRAV